MKFLSHFTIRAFVVLGLSLGCAKAQLSKEEVMLFFEDIDIAKTGCYLNVGVGISNGKVKQQWQEIWVANGIGRKIVFLENSFLVTRGNVKSMYSYRHIKTLKRGFNGEDEPFIWIEQE